MSDKTGGAAFPVPGFTEGTPEAPVTTQYPETGMTLRDYFAAQALVGILAFPGAVNGNRDKAKGQVVSAAYSYADAMLAERDR